MVGRLGSLGDGVRADAAAEPAAAHRLRLPRCGRLRRTACADHACGRAAVDRARDRRPRRTGRRTTPLAEARAGRGDRAVRGGSCPAGTPRSAPRGVVRPVRRRSDARGGTGYESFAQRSWCGGSRRAVPWGHGWLVARFDQCRVGALRARRDVRHMDARPGDPGPARGGCPGCACAGRAGGVRRAAADRAGVARHRCPQHGVDRGEGGSGQPCPEGPSGGGVGRAVGDRDDEPGCAGRAASHARSAADAVQPCATWRAGRAA